MTKFLLFLFVCVCYLCGLSLANDDELTCSLSEHEQQQRDPALQEMHYDVGNGDETFWAYVEPNVASFYQRTGNEKKITHKSNIAFAGKFINMSDKTIYLYWEQYVGSPNPVLMNTLRPFETGGTATYTSHRWFFTTQPPSQKIDQSKILKRFQIGPYPQSIYTYDPYFVEGDPKATEANLQQLPKHKRALYDQWKQTLEFSQQYEEFTGRPYLANYPQRPPPSHFMWRADALGDIHWVTSRETHFVEFPPENLLEQKITSSGKNRKLKPEDPRLLAEYRDPNQTILNMTLKVLSCAPRAFEIQNFLSPVEVAHVLDIAGGVKLSRSTVGNVGDGAVGNRAESDTRTSRNAWVYRETSPIIDAIYRRAADLLKIDEALLRYRDPGEFDERLSKRSLAEPLQLVHYDPGQEYTPHHDFGYSALGTHQGARFATLLLYLNEGMTGGETGFPRWANAETTNALKVTPQVGKAVLFYSQLPDGNLDDLSLHTAIAVRKGEKWLTNLWIWDPVYRGA